MRRLFIPILALAFSVCASCSSPDEGARVNADIALSDANFDIVSDAFVYQCGTIDCHGNAFRNMRLYGYGSQRLDPQLGPDSRPGFRFPAEIRHNYDAITGVEPEKLIEVVNEGGRDPERLAIVAKARAVQNHKGGPVMKPGDPIDDCITSWLAKNVAVERCRASTKFQNLQTAK
jgi:hypothetical protein